MDELEDDRPDRQERERRIHELRTEAIREIWSARGLDGVVVLLSDSDGWTVGRYAARCAANLPAAIAVLRTCLSTEAKSPEKLDAFMQGFLSCINEDVRATVLSTLAKTANVDQRVRFFTCAPFRGQTWRLLDQQDCLVRHRYWRTVFPAPTQFAEDEINELIDCLLEAERPQAAFFAVQFDWNRIETSRLMRLLKAIVEVTAEPVGHFKIESYDLSDALDSLGRRPGVTVDDMAQLEFACIEVLDHSEHAIPNVERKIAESPSLFVQILALLFRRKDDGQDPPEWRVDDPDRRASLQSAAYRLLQEVARIPGAAADEVDVHALSQWVTEARRLCRENGRGTIGDQQIGQLLSRAPSERDGRWPCRSVCEVLESIASEDIARGFEVGVYNARSVVSRSLNEGWRAGTRAVDQVSRVGGTVGLRLPLRCQHS